MSYFENTRNEDAAHVSGDPGVAALGIRKATPANVSGTDGDYEPFQISAGRVWTSTLIDTALPTGANVIGGVTQSGTWNIGSITTLPALVAGTANIGDVDVLTVPADPFGVNADAASATGSISAKLRFIASTGIPITGTVTVGSHAVTNAGTFVVQENGSALTALQLIDDTVVAQGTALGTTKNSLIGGSVTTNAPTYTTGQINPFSLTTAGELRVNLASVPSHAVTNAGTFAVQATIASGTTSFVKAEDDASANLDAGAAVMAVRKATPANTSGTDGDYEFLQMSAGRLWASATIDAAIPAGTNNIGDVDVLTVPSDPFGANADAASATGSISAKLRFIAATGIPITGTVTVGSHAVTNAGTFAVQVDGNALTSLQLMDDVVYTDDAAFTPGTSKIQGIGLIADETATDSVDEGDIGAPRMTLDRKQITSVYAHTTGGWTPYKLISAGTTNATSVKGSAGQLGSIVCFNLNASPRYVKLYNKATAPTVGTDTPVQVYMIPGNTTGAGFVIPPTPGLDFTTGIAFAITTGITDADTGAVAANEIIVNLGYK